MLWLFARTVRHSLVRLTLAAVGVAFPVAVLGATLLFIDGAVSQMTAHALAPVQVEMRALATSLDVDMNAVGRGLATVRGVGRVDRFATADVVVSAPGTGRLPARLYAVDPSYLDSHPWVRASTRPGGGALLSTPLPGAPAATTITVDLPGETPEDAQPLALSLPVRGAVDVRSAHTWSAIPLGEVQGDIAVVPRAVLVDYATFESLVLPAVKRLTVDGGTGVFNQGATDLPPVSVEFHVAVSHDAYPTDPARALAWSTALRRTLERQVPGAVVVADNAAEVLTMATEDATNAKILFLLLGIPGALVAGGLGVAAATAIGAAQRREEALLRLRGATSGQLARLNAAHTALAGAVGAAMGLVVAGLAVAWSSGREVWREVPPDRLAVTGLIAVAAGLLTTVTRLVPLVRAGRHVDVVTARRPVERRAPTGVRRDVVLVAVALAILGINALAGGLRQTTIEGQTLALAFYVLLAPILLWFAVTMLVIRGLRTVLVRRTRRPGPLGTWPGAALRWLGRRPARTGAALVLGTLAVAFGTNVVTFTATYRAARLADARAAFGSDLRLTPADASVAAAAVPPRPGPAVVATTPVRHVPARVGTDRKNLLAIDVATYRRTVTIAPSMLVGRGVEALAENPNAVLVNFEIADGFAVSPGDSLTLTVFPDDPNRTRNLTLLVAGVYRSFPPDDPFAELVTAAAAIPGPPVPVDFHLAKVRPGTSAADLARANPGYTVTTLGQQVVQEQRSLTTLDLRGLSRLESLAAATVAAVGVAVLGAFLVRERGRETAILRAGGATTAQALTAPAVEGAIAVVGSLLIGIPLGIGLAALGIRVLQLFFMRPPPLIVVPVGALAGLALCMVVLSAVALGGALRRAARQDTASALRESDGQ
ncbi:ABC transporter permease [Virgisporangium aurantiacum]|uniref:ABC3 transporter permease C-terminal domain-containing protein n=1 Tax=Virgisporangium aurantiacum TaxID=175570 RepID=A0A8J4DY68_9ACTN|nr:FtsX-like permease family protein [Virgisporangium aurantiacum]GIJ54133.1 hypothetical protein Vau01_016490 [Virgisporangium aurantiacum]